MIRDINMRTIAFLAIGVFVALSTATIAGAVVLHVVWYHQEEAAKAATKAAEEDWTAHHCDNCQAPESEDTRDCKRRMREAFALFGVNSPLWGRKC
jgi:hypothetical protein